MTQNRPASLKSTRKLLKKAIPPLVFLVLGVNAPANADTFTFSFSNTTGNVAGTVMGEIIGLTNNSSGPASQVLITNFPSGLNSVVGSAPIDATAWIGLSNNYFTETNGVVTNAVFYSQNASSTPTAQLELNYYNLDLLDLNFPSYYVANSGLQGITFAAAPEPATWLLLATSLGGLTWARPRRSNTV